jgi:hypothetical protein
VDYAHCADFAGLRQALARHQDYIGPMTAGLRQAIGIGAARTGSSGGAVDCCTMSEIAGRITLLSHARRTTRRRRRRTLTLSGYLATDGVRGAIAERRKPSSDRLDQEQRVIARQIFLRLTELGEARRIPVAAQPR